VRPADLELLGDDTVKILSLLVLVRGLVAVVDLVVHA